MINVSRASQMHSRGPHLNKVHLHLIMLPGGQQPPAGHQPLLGSAGHTAWPGPPAMHVQGPTLPR